jgi:glycosyltransferase involved in cell wall biosynthesis
MPAARRHRIAGLFADETAPDSLWIRETGRLELPALKDAAELTIEGELLPPAPADRTARGPLGLEVRLDGRTVCRQENLPVGPFTLRCPLPAEPAAGGHGLEFTLLGVGLSNTLAWLGRVSGLGFLQPWRRQGRNRRLRLHRLAVAGATLCDFGHRSSPWNRDFVRRHLDLGLNLVGYFRADLGIGESVRCAARAAEAAGLTTACVDLRLPCKNSMGDDTYTARLQRDNPHPFNVIHVDAPGMRDLDHHHGAAFRTGKYTIGYWAWELPEFPDSWVECADYCQEVWAPSHFTADAIAEKVPVPVLVMPHAMAFARPTGDFHGKFGLPRDRFLFLFLYDLNSYSARKNPAAALEAFRRSGLAGKDAALVIKVHNVAGNEADYERLRATAATLPGTVLLDRTLSRQEIYELESACDCFVSLHRSEGYGLAVAESMYLGKPVISTDWSATAEFVTSRNGCPVPARLVTLERNIGPYAKGQTWADPDVEQAAWWMRRLVEDHALGPQLGAAARATIEERFSPAVIGARYRRRLEALAGRFA